MSLQFLLSSTVFPKLFLIAYRLWGTYCHQSPCSTLFQENIFNQISFDQKFRNLDLTQKRYVQMAVRNYKASTQECRNLFSGVDQELICPYRPTRSLRSESKNLCSSLPHSHLREQVVQRRNRNPLERPAARNARCWEPLPRSQDCWKLTFLILSFLKIVVQYVLSVF